MTNDSPRQARRRENLRRLIGDQPGAQAQLALEIDTPKSHLSAILAGRRGIGDRLAEKIEKHFERPPGWMDAADPDSELPSEFAVLADEANRLPTLQRDWVLMTLREAVKLARETLTESHVAAKDESAPAPAPRRQTAA